MGANEDAAGAVARYRQLLDWPRLVKNATLDFHWVAPQIAWTVIEDHRGRACYLVDAANADKELLFEEDAVKDLVSVKDLMSATTSERLQIFSVDVPTRVVRFGLQGKVYDLHLHTNTVAEVGPTVIRIQQTSRPRRVRCSYPQTIPDVYESPSPSGRWLITLVDGAVGVRSSTDEQSQVLTPPPEGDCEWQIDQTRWSADEEWVAVQRIDFHGVERSPLLHVGGSAIAASFPYATAGSTLPRTDIVLINRLSRLSIEVRLPDGFQYQHLQQFIAAPGESAPRLLVFGLDRLCQVASLFESDSRGEGRVVFQERMTTFFQWPFDFKQRAPALFLSADRFLWQSERSGCKQIYVIERTAGGAFETRCQLTNQPFPIEALTAFDAAEGIVFYTARSDGQRPFDVHLHRCDLSGADQRQLTEGRGIHQIIFAPGHGYFLDSWSNPIEPPQHEIRSSQGSLKHVLARADINALIAAGWIAPREFSVLASDARTVVHGLLFAPADRAQAKSAPVVEYIYGGPFVAVVPRTFVPTILADHLVFAQALAQLGFAVVVLDARGTPGRDKAFHDAAYHSWGTYEIADHAAALRQLAEQHENLDLERVGIFGNSYGGYFATRALLTAPDLYKVAVAGAPAQDLRTINAASIELYLGQPEDNPSGYDEASNLALAGALRGRLLLIHPMLDVNAPLSQTLRFSEALINADRPFDLLLMPGLNHQYMAQDCSARHPYFRQSVARYFLQHLKPETSSRLTV